MNFDFNFFEYVLTYNAIKTPNFLPTIVEHIEPKFFENACVKTILFKVKDFFLEHKTVPNLTEIKSRLANDDEKQHFKQLLLEFKKLDTKYNEDELTKNTEHFLKTKAVYNAVLNTAGTIGQGDEVDLAKTLKEFEGACGISLVDNFGLDFLDDIDEYAKTLGEIHKTFSTGLKWLDRMLGGGIMAAGKALYIVSAATNMGKSVVLTNIASAALAQEKKVVIFTLEMSENVYAKRASSCITKIPLKILNDSADNLVSEIKNYKEIHPESQLIIKEYPTKSATVATLKAYLDKLVQQKDFVPDLIVVDYLNLLRPAIVTGQSYGDIKSITEDLRGLSYSYGGIPIWSATQLNRCIALDSKVLHKTKGVINIGNIRKNDKIATATGFTNVTKVFPITKQQCVRITTKSGKQIVCSKNHIFPTTNGEKTIESGLSIGDALLTVQR